MILIQYSIVNVPLSFIQGGARLVTLLLLYAPQIVYYAILIAAVSNVSPVNLLCVLCIVFTLKNFVKEKRKAE